MMINHSLFGLLPHYDWLRVTAAAGDGGDIAGDGGDIAGDGGWREYKHVTVNLEYYQKKTTSEILDHSGSSEYDSSWNSINVCASLIC